MNRCSFLRPGHKNFDGESARYIMCFIYVIICDCICEVFLPNFGAVASTTS